ncbi:hypothetical protein RI129_010515 [Pyrocoelia pectoralis]|uniref:Uncharacterized protein n=1 Tax=Pyrocoelia pectoralis TaxID=417401 RepID=A0AAN7V844_9COLE
MSAGVSPSLEFTKRFRHHKLISKITSSVRIITSSKSTLNLLLATGIHICASGVRIVTRQFLYDRIKNEDLPNLDAKLDFLRDQLFLEKPYNENQIDTLKRSLARFKSQIKQRWIKAHYKEDNFLKYNKSWLQGTFEIPVCERSKRRKTEELRSTFEKDVIVHAAQVELGKSGKRDASNVLKDITRSPRQASKYKKAFKSSGNKQCSLTPMQALQMFIDADLTQGQYEIIRKTNKKFFPCYSRLQNAKKQCYPPQESCIITSTSAEVQLQPLMDITIKRLFVYLEEVLETLKKQERESLTIVSKWGCDGSQQSQYKQKMDSDDSDANIFQSCFVPLQLVCGDNKNTLWQNKTPSSPRFCRPIRFRFVKENNDVTEEEISYVTEAISSLIPTVIDIQGKKFVIKHKFVMTMVDGKVCNAATGTRSTSRCYICGATSKEFNNLDFTRDVNFKAVEFGISVLHARIRIFESILHLAYKLPVKKYRERKTKEEKDLEDERKKYIQARFRAEIGLIVDMPKSNFGNTNDGNTSRRFFENPGLASEITGIDYELIYRLKVILEAISSGHKIDPSKYEKYATETARLYLNKYDWHPMTPTLHKVLLHGAVIIEKALLPIGQLSEEAAEARNKHFRSYRQDFARKFSRESCNQDVFNRLILSSDPLLSSTRGVKKRKTNTFLPETRAMLVSAEPNLIESLPSSSESDSDTC